MTLQLYVKAILLQFDALRYFLANDNKTTILYIQSPMSRRSLIPDVWLKILL